MIDYLIPIIIAALAGAFFYFIINNFRNRSGNGADHTELDQLRQDKSLLERDKEHLKSRLENAKEEFKKQETKEDNLLKENNRLNAELATAKANLKSLEEKLNEQEANLTELQNKFNKDFQLVADRILKENSKEFSQSHQKELDQILKPLKEKIKTFEESIEKKYDSEKSERITLKTEIKHLLEMNKTLNEQAQNLTNALKGESKTRGNWGELVLERILESSGLIEGEEYETQYSDTNSENKRIQPDVIIKLPDEKHLIVDSKVSLVAYDAFVSAETEEEKANQLKQHLTSVRTHVTQLSHKNYQSGKNLNSPDFVLLFMPIEPAFSLAVQEDSQLYAFAWEKKVVIVSPTTLLATLRTIASVWKNEKVAKNIEEIKNKAGDLYDKFVGFLDDMAKIERGLSSAQSAYDEAYNKLADGRGNIVRRIKHIKSLGITSKKEIPAEFDKDADQEEEVLE